MASIKKFTGWFVLGTLIFYLLSVTPKHFRSTANTAGMDCQCSHVAHACAKCKASG